MSQYFHNTFIFSIGKFYPSIVAYQLPPMICYEINVKMLWTYHFFYL